MRALKFCIILPICALLYACSPSSTKKEQNTPNTPALNDGIHTFNTYNALKENMNWSWAYLDSCEREKLNLVYRLLDEVSYNPAHESSQLIALQNLTASTKQQLITRDNIGISGTIENFDLLSDSLIRSVNNYVRSTKNMDHYPLAAELMHEIDSINNVVILKERIRFSDYCSEHNDFIATNKTTLESVGTKEVSPQANFYIEE